jgi:hypothetical protein
MFKVVESPSPRLQNCQKEVENSCLAGTISPWVGGRPRGTGKGEIPIINEKIVATSGRL